VTGYLGWLGWDFYATPLVDRPLHPDYDLLKPTGLLGHGYGVVGTLMIIAGVILYSTRKRFRRVSSWGKISYYLEVHIFLCLLGPILVLFHTTFKFGGLVAVSFWSMTAVVLSGVLGRYFYVQIPRGIRGNELSIADLENEKSSLDAQLRGTYSVGEDFLVKLNALAIPPKPAQTMSFLGTLRYFAIDDLLRRYRLRKLIASARHSKSTKGAISQMRHIARRRLVLARRIAFLEHFRKLFYYWHVIHLPFALVMLIILLIHVGVAVAFGYTWMF
jgi:hypothetical protein